MISWKGCGESCALFLLYLVMGKLLDLQQIKAEIMIRREIDYVFYKNAPKKTKVLSEVITNQPKFRCMRGNYRCFMAKIRRVLSFK